MSAPTQPFGSAQPSGAASPAASYAGSLRQSYPASPYPGYPPGGGALATASPGASFPGPASGVATPAMAQSFNGQPQGQQFGTQQSQQSQFQQLQQQQFQQQQQQPGTYTSQAGAQPPFGVTTAGGARPDTARADQQVLNSDGTAAAATEPEPGFFGRLFGKKTSPPPAAAVAAAPGGPDVVEVASSRWCASKPMDAENAARLRGAPLAPSKFSCLQGANEAVAAATATWDPNAPAAGPTAQPGVTNTPQGGPPPETQMYGPFLRYGGYDPSSHAYYASVMVCIHQARSPREPTLKFRDVNVPRSETQVKATHIEHYRGFNMWRFDLTVLCGVPERTVEYWIVPSGANVFQGQARFRFIVPGVGQHWRWGFYSCNGFHDAEVEKECGGIQPLWRDVLFSHEQRPIHVMIGGGDQLYNDDVWNLPSLVAWLGVADKATKLAYPFTQEMADQQRSAAYSGIAPRISMMQNGRPPRDRPAQQTINGKSYAPAECRAELIRMKRTYSDAEKIRRLIQDHMLEMFNKVLGIASNCPTRFAISHMITLDLLEAKDAIKSACISDEWDIAAASSTHGDEFKELVLEYQPRRTGRGRPERPYKFWTEVPRLIELVQPISDAIHKTEADCALLSQGPAIFQPLQNHVLAFVDKYKDDPSAPDYADLPAIFEARMLKHCPIAAYAAFALDPLYFNVDASGSWTPALCRLDDGDLEGVRVKTYYERFVEPEQIKTLHLELATLQLEPLPKKIESLYKVCSSRREEVDGKKIKIIITLASSHRGLWTKNLANNGFPLLALCANCLLSMRATSAASERNWSVWGHIFTNYRTRLGLIKGEMLVFIRGNSETVIITDGDEFEEISLEMLEEILEGEEEE
ncbi:hypothetical protein FOA52_000518 [Chlamydomonas sp. UWO 241]|nr:hypothetical protein FOA52_000518 [Chlamydomonas sp. UWO 241]